MILLIDAGNTRVKWRLTGPGAVGDGAFEHDRVDLLDAVFTHGPSIRRVVGANVAGPRTAQAIEARATAAGVTPEWLVASAQCCGVTNLYERPDQLGADRWAALIGARALHPHACLVVMAGTATTVDVLDSEGRFLGGLILPGVELMRRALAFNTAQLPLAEGRFSTTPRNTADAIHSGCLQAQAGAIERMFRQIEAAPDACCLLGGGAADAFADLLDLPLRRVDNLVLDGLDQITRTTAS